MISKREWYAALRRMLKRPTAYFPQTLRLMRALSIPVEEMRAAISYPW